jgi:hypothetical protein
VVDRHVRAANREPLEHAIERYLARRQDQEMAFVDRGADRKTGTGSGPSSSWRGPESRIASAAAGALAAIVALLALAALAVRVIG